VIEHQLRLLGGKASSGQSRKSLKVCRRLIQASELKSHSSDVSYHYDNEYYGDYDDNSTHDLTSSL